MWDLLLLPDLLLKNSCTSPPSWESLIHFLGSCSSLSFCLFVSEERRVLQPSDCVYSESLTPQGKLVACRRDLTEILVCKWLHFFLSFCNIQSLKEAQVAACRSKAKHSKQS